MSAELPLSVRDMDQGSDWQNTLIRILRKLKSTKLSRYQRRLNRRGWYDSSIRSTAPAIFIGGCGRSGTTLFREILNRHSKIFCGPETSIFGIPFTPSNIADSWALDLQYVVRLEEKSANLVGFAEEFFHHYTKLHGKLRWADKTPNNIREIAKILTWFPHCRFIHVLRDGRDVVCSLRNHPRERVVKGKLVPVDTRNSIKRCTERWVRDVCCGMPFLSHPRCILVKYENLVLHTEAELRRVYAFLGEEYEHTQHEIQNPSADPLNVGRYSNNPNAGGTITANSIGRWRRDLTHDERRIFCDIAGELLISTEYVTDQSWITAPIV